MIQKTVERVCEALSKRLEKRIITRRDGKPYLERYYILHSDTFRWLPGIYLHKFLSSDEDHELHDHPWGTSVSLILTGGYYEDFRYGDAKGRYRVNTRRLWPGQINIIHADTFHRVDLIEPYAWTLFMSGDRKQDWGFWDQDTKIYTPWRRHTERKSNE